MLALGIDPGTAICGLKHARIFQLQTKSGVRIADILEAQRNPLSKR